MEIVRKSVEERCEGQGYLEVVHYLKSYRGRWNQNQLLRAADAAQVRSTGWPIGVVLQDKDLGPVSLQNAIYVTVDQAELSMGELFDHWYLGMPG